MGEKLSPAGMIRISEGVLMVAIQRAITDFINETGCHSVDVSATNMACTGVTSVTPIVRVTSGI